MAKLAISSLLIVTAVSGKGMLLIQTTTDIINSPECGLCKVAWDAAQINYDNRADQIAEVESLWGAACGT